MSLEMKTSEDDMRTAALMMAYAGLTAQDIARVLRVNPEQVRGWLREHGEL